MDASSSSDANNDELTYSWKQLSGSIVSLTATGSSISFEAPKVSTDEVISFQLEVSDGNGNSDITVATANITKNKGDSGSFGWLMALFTPLLFVRRRKNNS